MELVRIAGVFAPASAAAGRAEADFGGYYRLGPLPRALPARAAELLGVSLRTVRNKIRSYGLPRWEGGSIHDGKAGSPGS